MRHKLGRLGVTLSASALAAGLAETAAGTVPPVLIETTLAAGSSAAAARELAEGVMRGMALLTLAKRSTVALGLLAAGIVLVPWAGAEQKPGPKDVPKAEERPAAKTDAERFQGVWVVSQALASRKVFEPTWMPDADSLAFYGDRVQEDRLPGREKTFVLRTDGDTKQIEIILSDVPDGLKRGTKRIGGWYEFVGDELHLVLAMDGVPKAKMEVALDGPPVVDLRLRRQSDLDREYARLRGAWLVNNAVEQTPAFHQLDVRGKGFRFGSVSDPQYFTATATIDPSKSPKQIDLKLDQPWRDFPAGTVVKGIYDVDGDDLALALGLEDRPTNFRPNARSMATVFERLGRARKPRATEKSKEKPAAKDSPAYKIRQLQQELAQALRTQLEGQFERVKIGKDPLITLLDLHRELWEVEMVLAADHAGKLKACEEYLRHAKVIEEQLVELQMAGLNTKQGVAQAKAPG